AAVGEFEGEGGDVVFAVEHDFAEVGGAQVEEFCPAGAVFKGKLGLDVVAGGDEGIEAGSGVADQADGAVVGGVGDADLAGLLHDLQGRVVINPLILGADEISGVRVHFGRS